MSNLYTQELMENTVSFVSASMEHVQRHVDALLEKERLTKKERAVRLDNERKSRLLKLLEEIYHCSTMSVRRSLLQYLVSRGVDIDENLYLFADEAEEDELLQYVPLLLQYSAEKDDPWEKTVYGTAGFRKVDRKKRKKISRKELTKEAAFQLGHNLRFSPEEMEAFLVRTMEAGAFDFTSSVDIVHFFCFVTDRTQKDAEEMLDAYALFAKQDRRPKVKLEEKPQGFTEGICLTMEAIVPQWVDGGNDREAFLTWLQENAPKLDIPSQKAHDLLYRLARFYAELCVQEKETIPTTDAIVYEIQKIIDEDSSLQWSLEEAETLGKGVLRSTEWYCLNRRPSGSIEEQAIGDDILQALAGKEPVSKADLLTMLFTIFELPYDQIEISDTIDSVQWGAHFMGCATRLLKKAHMHFYLPHFLEYSFVSSITAQMPLEKLLVAKKDPRAPEKDEKKQLRAREHDMVKQAAEAFAYMAQSEELAATVNALTAHFEDRLEGQVVFLSDGVVALNTIFGIGQAVCSCCAPVSADAATIRRRAGEIYKKVYGGNDEKKELVIAKKVYMLIIGEGIRSVYPEKSFIANAKKNMLLTLNSKKTHK